MGNFKGGKKHGRGKMIYGNSHVYEGDFMNGKQHGRGQWTDPDPAGGIGHVYEGMWKNGKKHGFGTMTLSDGSTFEGVWEKGKKLGEAMAYSTGILYDEEE
jgi:hypothetical protein